jgi:hypothetical protein
MSGPDVWGPHGWKFIHYVTLGYPINPTDMDKERYSNFFNILQYVIPCSICASHFQKQLKEAPLTDEILSDKMKFIEWGISRHNLVNKLNNKKVYTFEEGYKDIKKNFAMECHSDMFDKIDKFDNTSLTNNEYIYIVLISIILILLIVCVKLYKK